MAPSGGSTKTGFSKMKTSKIKSKKKFYEPKWLNDVYMTPQQRLIPGNRPDIVREKQLPLEDQEYLKQLRLGIDIKHKKEAIERAQ